MARILIENEQGVIIDSEVEGYIVMMKDKGGNLRQYVGGVSHLEMAGLGMLLVNTSMGHLMINNNLTRIDPQG